MAPLADQQLASLEPDPVKMWEANRIQRHETHCPKFTCEEGHLAVPHSPVSWGPLFFFKEYALGSELQFYLHKINSKLDDLMRFTEKKARRKGRYY